MIDGGVEILVKDKCKCPKCGHNKMVIYLDSGTISYDCPQCDYHLCKYHNDIMED